MNKELLTSRLNLLRQEHEKQKNVSTTQHNLLMAYDGAIQECVYWLNQCQTTEIVKGEADAVVGDAKKK
jgi:hypothetical protein